MKNKMKQIVFSILLIFLPNNIFATEVFSDVRRISISGDENRIEIKNIKLRQKQKVFFYFENCQIGEGKTKFYKEFAYGYADLHGEPHARLCPVMLNDKQIEAAHFHKDGYNKHMFCPK